MPSMYHVDLMWMRAKGLSDYMTRSDEFRNYVCGFEPRVSFPHTDTIHQLVLTVDALQEEKLSSSSRSMGGSANSSRMGRALDCKSTCGTALSLRPRTWHSRRRQWRSRCPMGPMHSSG